MSDWLSKVLLGNLLIRFTTTCSLHLPWVAYFLTGYGLNYFRYSNPNKQAEFREMTTRALNIYMIERHIPEEKRNKNLQAFMTYLNDADVDVVKEYQFNPVMYWRLRQIADKNDEFSKVAEEILQIPATEAACERVFSSLSAATKSERCNVQEQTLDARLTVKFECIFNRAGKVSLDELASDPQKALKLSKYSFPTREHDNHVDQGDD